jgi:6-phosphogluconolactonase
MGRMGANVGVRGMWRWLIAAGLAAGMLAPPAASATNTVYASNEVRGTVSAFSVGADGLLTQVGTGTTSGSGYNPFPSQSEASPGPAAVSMDGQYLFVVNDGGGSEYPGTVATFLIGAGGALTEVGQVPTGPTSTYSTPSPGGVAVSPGGQYLFVTNFGQNTVATFSIGAGGALTQVGAPAVSGGGETGSEPEGIVVSPNGENVYVTNNNDGSNSSATVSTFAVGAGGTLTPVGAHVPIEAGAPSSEPSGIAITPNGQYLYASNFISGNVSTFAIGAGGALTQVGTPVSSAEYEAGNITVAPDGGYLYVANSYAGTVSTFSIGAGGTLTPVGSPVPSGADSHSTPNSPAVSPNGQYLYDGNYGAFDGTLSTFSIGAGGALAPIGAPVESGSRSDAEPDEVVVSPDQGPTAAFTPARAPARSPSAFSAAVSTAGSAPIASYSWQFGDGGSASGAAVDHVFAAPGTYSVALTITDTDLCSVSGPFVGQTPYCVIDPAATITHAITVPAAGTAAKLIIGSPTVAHGSITGITKGKPKLAFTLIAGKNAPALHTITVSPPSGLSFSTKKKNLAQHITVQGAAFTAKVSHGTLTITLPATAAQAQVTITGPELSASKRLRSKVKKSEHHKAVKLTFKLKATDIDHAATALSLTLYRNSG